MPFTSDNIDKTRELYNCYNDTSISEKSNNLVKFIKSYFDYEPNKNSKAIIGISTGKDSTCLLGLLTKALGPELVICVSMPLNLEYKDQEGNRYSVSNPMHMRQETVDILDYFKIPDENRIFSPILDHHSSVVDYRLFTPKNSDINETIQCSWDMAKPEVRNLAARMRMVKLYYLAQLLNARVMNTSNLSESVIGWFTKWGDCAGDLYPFIELTASEVVMIGLDIGIPEKWMFKVPDDGLIGTSDEEALGFTYNDLDEIIWGVNEHAKVYNEDIRITFERMLPDSIKNRFISSMHKRFSVEIPQDITGFNPVFKNLHKEWQYEQTRLYQAKHN